MNCWGRCLIGLRHFTRYGILTAPLKNLLILLLIIIHFYFNYSEIPSLSIFKTAFVLPRKGPINMRVHEISRGPFEMRASRHVWEKKSGVLRKRRTKSQKPKSSPDCFFCLAVSYLLRCFWILRTYSKIRVLFLIRHPPSTCTQVKAAEDVAIITMISLNEHHE